MKKLSLLFMLLLTLLFISCAAPDDKMPNNNESCSTNSISEEETATVEESEHLTEIDLTSFVSISFSGREPQGTATITISNGFPDALRGAVSFKLSSYINLSNGENIFLNISYDADAVKKAGYVITNKKDAEYTVSGLSTLIELDPFDGLQLDYFGISPFCKVAINDSKCPLEVQKYVTYTVSGETFASGDTVIVTAELSKEATQEYGYILKGNINQKEYIVSDVPYYVNDLDDVDVSYISSELRDYILSEISFEKKYTVLGQDAWGFLETYGDRGNNWCDFFNVPSVISNDAYMLTIKEKSKENFTNGDSPYNTLVILATCTAEASHQSSHDMWYGKGEIYVAFRLNNIVMYPDGSIGWGNDSPDTLDIQYSSTLNGLNSLIETNVTSHSRTYNSTNLKKKDWINIVE